MTKGDQVINKKANRGQDQCDAAGQHHDQREFALDG